LAETVVKDTNAVADVNKSDDVKDLNLIAVANVNVNAKTDAAAVNLLKNFWKEGRKSFFFK
jgi:hypothetical protein